MAPIVVWTIGHSNQSLDEFAQLLARERIDVVLDVRSYPYSRYAPQFNREDVAGALRDRGMRYGYFGEELGGRPLKDEHYDEDGHALYAPMSREPAFVQALARVLDGACEHRIALMCSEADPHDCHRRLLVGKVLAEQGVELRHILRGGGVEVERSVELDTNGQAALFEAEEARWRSTRSVSRRRRLSGSSAA